MGGASKVQVLKSGACISKDDGKMDTMIIIMPKQELHQKRIYTPSDCLIKLKLLLPNLHS